jgi:hypothetical protein
MPIRSITRAKMKFLLAAVSLVATATAFTASPAAFTTRNANVGSCAVDNVVAEGSAHSNRRATIVMDGKANGEFVSFTIKLPPNGLRKRAHGRYSLNGLTDLNDGLRARVTCLPIPN